MPQVGIFVERKFVVLRQQVLDVGKTSAAEALLGLIPDKAGIRGIGVGDYGAPGPHDVLAKRLPQNKMPRV